MTLNEKLEALLLPIAEEMDFDIVRMQMQGGDTRKVLQIMAERKDRKGMTIDDCASLSRAFSYVLDEQDPIEDNYTLEVSSPGIDRPLVKKDDFDRFKGFDAKVESGVSVDGRKRFSGKLQGVDDDDIVITFQGADVKIPFINIVKAKLILTDELIDAFASEQDKE